MIVVVIMMMIIIIKVIMKSIKVIRPRLKGNCLV